MGLTSRKQPPHPTLYLPQGSAKSLVKKLELHEGISVQWVVLDCSFKENKGPVWI